MEYKREELIALMREMEKQIALCHIRPQLAGALADELERSVPVIRCRDCKYYNTVDWDGNVLCGCNLKSGMVDIYPDGFCSYGEKRCDGAN